MSAVSSAATTRSLPATLQYNRIQSTIESTVWSHAACLGPHQEIFFPPTVAETRRSKRRREARAKEICATCPIQSGCLTTALSRNEQHGIWGGHTAKERRLILLSS